MALLRSTARKHLAGLWSISQRSFAASQPMRLQSGGAKAPTTLLDAHGNAVPAPAPTPAPAPAAGSAGSAAPGTSDSADDDLILDLTAENFQQYIQGPTPIILDFWAPWCGPCREFTPRLEAAVRAAGGAVRLGKVNTDEQPQLAQALQVKSLPTVIGVAGGKAVAMSQGALPEAELKDFMDKILAAAGGEPTEASTAVKLAQIVEAADTAMLGGHHDSANALLMQAAQAANEARATEADAKTGAVPDELKGVTAEIVAAQLRLAMVLDNMPAADECVKTLKSAEYLKFLGAPRVAASVAQHTLYQVVSDDPRVKELSLEAAQEAAEAEPSNAEPQLLYAKVAAASGNLDLCVAAALNAVRMDKGDVRERSKTLLLAVFDALGPNQPLTQSGRKRLSQMLFM